MQCTMLPPRVSYLEARDMLARQREAIMAKIRQFSRSHVVHRGRDIFPPGVMSVDPRDVPGLRDLGWTPQMDELTRRPTRGPQFSIMQRLLTDMQNQPAAWAFSRPVNKDEVRCPVIASSLIFQRSPTTTTSLKRCARRPFAADTAELSQPMDLEVTASDRFSLALTPVQTMETKLEHGSYQVGSVQRRDELTN